MKFKKTQVSIEFILIFLFILFIATIVIFIMGNYSKDLVTNQDKREADDFANYIISETELLDKVTPGYYRKIKVSNTLVNRFNFTISNSYLILNPTELSSRFTTEPLYYYIPGNNSINLSVEGESTYLIFSKENIEDENIIVLN